MGTGTQEMLGYGYKKAFSKIGGVGYQKIIVCAALSFLFGRAALFNCIFPFGTAWLVVLVNRSRRNICYAPLIFLGIFSNSFSKYYILSYLLVTIFCGVVFCMFRHITSRSEIASALSAAAISIFVGTAYQYFAETLLLFNIFMLLTEAIAIIAFVHIFSLLAGWIENPKNGRCASKEDMICILASVAVGFAGVGEIEFFNARLTYVVAMLITMIAARRGGVHEGGITGIILGIVATAIYYHSPAVIGLLGFSGMAAGFFKESHKILNGIFFMAVFFIFAFFVTGFSEIYVTMPECLAAFFLFALIPEKLISKTDRIFKNMARQDIGEELHYSNQLKNHVAGSLKRYAATFENLAVIYGRAYERKYPVEKEDISEITEKIRKTLCLSCQSKNKCWEKWGQRTARIIENIICMADKGADINMTDFEKKYNFACENKFLLLLYIQSGIKISSLNYKWQNKMESSREAMSYQFKGMAKLLNKMSEEIDVKNRFNKDIEEKIAGELNILKIPFKSIVAAEEDWGCKIILDAGETSSKHALQIEKVVSSVMEKEYRITDKNVFKNDDETALILMPKAKYGIDIAVSRYAKAEDACGDSCMHACLSDSEYMIVLSDGMGSGEKAARESMITVNTLYYLLKAGFDAELALSAMNSMLVLKSTEEIFSTVDMCLLNLNSGKARFFKIGAAAAFIKRKETVEIIKYAALPIGIIDKIKIDEIEIKIQENDIIVMISDGISDAVIEDAKLEWIKDAIMGINSKDPQTISDLILNKAVEKYGEREKDDMTVIAAAIN